MMLTNSYLGMGIKGCCKGVHFTKLLGFATLNANLQDWRLGTREKWASGLIPQGS